MSMLKWLAMAALVVTPRIAHAQESAATAPAASPAAGSSGSGASAGTADGAASPQDIPTLDTTVPDAPAFTILGITPTQITRPKTPAEVAAAIATAIGTDGLLHTGAAIEIAPGQLFRAVDLKEYTDHWYYRYQHNAQISLGTSTTSAAMMSGMGMPAAATDLALGFRLTLYDSSDPLTNSDVMSAYKNAFSNRTPPSFPTSGGTPTDLPADIQSKLADAKANGWNPTAVQVAAACAWTSSDSSLHNLIHKGWGAWGTGAAGLGHWGQAVGVLRVLNGSANAADPGTTFVAGARLIVGGPKWGLSAEGAYNQLWASNSALNDRWGQATAAFEVNLASGSWLELAFGDTFDKLGQNDRFFSLANFKWSVSSQRVILSGQ